MTTDTVSVTIKDIVGDEESDLVVRVLALMSKKFQERQGLPPPVADQCAIQMLVDLLKGFGKWSGELDGVSVLNSSITPPEKKKKDTLQ